MEPGGNTRLTSRQVRPGRDGSLLIFVVSCYYYLIIIIIIVELP